MDHICLIYQSKVNYLHIAHMNMPIPEFHFEILLPSAPVLKYVSVPIPEGGSKLKTGYSEDALCTKRLTIKFWTCCIGTATDSARTQTGGVEMSSFFGPIKVESLRQTTLRGRAKHREHNQPKVTL